MSCLEPTAASSLLLPSTHGKQRVDEGRGRPCCLG